MDQREVDSCRLCGFIFLDKRRKRNIVGESAGIFETVVGVEIRSKKVRALQLADRSHSLLAQSHDTPLLPPQKICIGIVLDFSWDIFMSQEKSQTMIMQNFFGEKMCIMGFVQAGNVRSA